MIRIWHRSFAVALGVFQIFATSDFVAAGERAAEKMLPKDTLAFFSVSSVPEAVKRFNKTSMGQLLQDPQLKPFLDDVGKKKDEWSKVIEGDIGLSLDEILQLPQGELTIAFVEKPIRRIAFIALLEYGNQKDSVDKFLKRLDEELEKQETDHTTEMIDSINLHIYKDKDPDSKDLINTVTYFTDDSYLVLSTEVEAIKDVLERWDGKSDDTLAQNDQFQYIQSQCKIDSGEPLVSVFLNPTGLIQTAISIVSAFSPEVGMAGGFLPLLGIDGLKGYGGVTSFDEGDYESIANFFIYAENPRALLGVFNFPAIEMSPPKWVPATVGHYVQLNWNVQGAYSAIENLVDSFQGRGATARLMEQVADQGPMINPKKDILDLLDGIIHFSQNAPKEESDEAQVPMICFALGLKDANQMKKTLASAAKSEQANIETREFNGETIYEVEQSGSDNTVSFAVSEGNLVLTNDTSMLEGMLRGPAGPTAALVDSDDYKKLAKLIPAKTSMQSFQRNDAQMKVLYNLLKTSDSDALEGIDVSKLPPFEAIAKYFLPSATFIVPDKKGAKTVTFTLKRND